MDTGALEEEAKLIVGQLHLQKQKSNKLSIKLSINGNRINQALDSSTPICRISWMLIQENLSQRAWLS